MSKPGIVTLDGDPIGVFVIDTTDENKLTIMFNKGAAGVEETLEFAAENGMTFGLSLQPDFHEAEATT